MFLGWFGNDVLSQRTTILEALRANEQEISKVREAYFKFTQEKTRLHNPDLDGARYLDQSEIAELLKQVDILVAELNLAQTPSRSIRRATDKFRSDLQEVQQHALGYKPQPEAALRLISAMQTASKSGYRHREAIQKFNGSTARAIWASAF